MKKNYKNPISYKNAIIYFAIIFSVLFTILIVALAQNEKNKVQSQEKEIKLKEDFIVEGASNRLGEEVSTILSDLNFLKQQYELYVNLKMDTEILGEEWRIFSEKRGMYDQIRFIDSNGDEKIRINYSNENAYVVEKSKLQNKKERYYFIETKNLSDKQTYISKIDLNMENSQIESPIKPVMRLCTPVYDSNNNFAGMIVLNYLAENMIDKFKSYWEESNGKLFLIDSNGYWVYSGDPENDWGFMYEAKKDISFKNSYKDEWETISNKEGSLTTSNGYFKFSNAILKYEINNNSELSSNKIVLGEGDIKIVSFIDSEGEYAYLFEKAFSIEKIIKIIKDNLIYFIFIIIISLFSAYLIFLRKKSNFDIKYFSEYDGLTNVLNRRAGFDLLDRKLISKDSKTKISLCFIDINGLKIVNDTFGHEEGDRLILTVVDTIKAIIRNTDFIIRMGGDEFIIIFDNSNIEQAEAVWTRILDKLSIINASEKRAYIVSASHGIVELDGFKRNMLDEFIEQADEKMYEEKKELKKKLVIIRERSEVLDYE